MFETTNHYIYIYIHIIQCKSRRLQLLLQQKELAAEVFQVLERSLAESHAMTHAPQVMENKWVIWERYGKPGNMLEIYGLVIMLWFFL